ncbi:hypothetical protein ACIGO8_09445 [Streptomyces sp. NPDC053493]|uniref:hypothetical protein n=1 Tax=Streptomyces sp. NPDC053493 TaxID=3365705 RepID=UPI0037D0BF60
MSEPAPHPRPHPHDHPRPHPYEIDLARRPGLSRPTVRQAIRTLVDKGRVVRRRHGSHLHRASRHVFEFQLLARG